MTADPSITASVCCVGLGNLPVLAREYGSLGAGGAELQQTLLARALVRRGFEVSMIVADHGQSDGAVWDGIKTYKAYRPGEGFPGLRFVHPRWTGLWSAMKRANADIYYTSCAGALVGQVAMFARLHRRKVVFRVASNSDCDPGSLLIRFWRDRQLYRYGLRHADLVLAQTPRQQRALLQNFGRGSRVVASLTEPGCARRCARRDFHERDIDALWVGNIRALKRPNLLLDVARRLPGISFHMIGGPMPGAEQLFEAVRVAAMTLPNVRFHGPVPYHEVGEFYERARVFAATSEIEGFPNTYLQAWTRGTPVVAFLDPEQTIARNGLGRTVTTVEEMVASIATLTADPARWEATSVRSRQYMDSRFSENAMLAPYIEALRGLCATNDGFKAGTSWHN